MQAGEKLEQELLSRIVRTSSDHDEILRAYSALIELDPKEFLGERAVYFEQCNRLDDALLDLNEAVRLNPDHWLRTRACFLYTHGNRHQAVIDFETIVDRQRKQVAQSTKGTVSEACAKQSFAESLYDMAMCQANAGDLERAVIALKEAGTIDQGYLYMVADFGQKYGMTILEQEALDALVEHHWMNLLRRAAFFEKHNQFDSSLRDLNTAVRAFPLIAPKDPLCRKSLALKERAEFQRRRGHNVSFVLDASANYAVMVIAGIIDLIVGTFFGLGLLLSKVSVCGKKAP